MTTLNGTVSYRERIALPPSAVARSSLVDVSLADAPATTPTWAKTAALARRWELNRLAERLEGLAEAGGE
jgi:uncharacterized lipoprotein YbaY